jgi:outer membrane murein-binding lipoprotein Lpp
MTKFLLLTTLAVALLFAGCKPSSNIEEFQKLVGQLDAKNKDIYEKSQDMAKLVKEYNAAHPNENIKFAAGDSVLGLTTEQQELLQQMIQKEQDVSYKGMLGKVIEANKQITDLRGEIDKIQAKLPKPTVVKRGDSHRKLAVEYLVKSEGLDEKKAKELTDKVALADELVPGFYVWLYYNDGVFGTFVTQGDAKVNPNKIKYSMRRQQMEGAVEQAKEQARREILDSLAKAGGTKPDTTKK